MVDGKSLTPFFNFTTKEGVKSRHPTIELRIDVGCRDLTPFHQGDGNPAKKKPDTFFFDIILKDGTSGLKIVKKIKINGKTKTIKGYYKKDGKIVTYIPND